ncbi:NADP-dependent oxidoreductase [Niveispirillum sp. KHB5.9]|uniref:NADP-dependent oxidoreductase n=1 Tax=Niveispirillum sp. KHB5.9 TaxID=3400269 RepID=UPI003A89D394
MNQRIVLARAVGLSPVLDDFRLEEAAMPAPGPGQVLIRVDHVSLDPYVASALRGRHMSGGVAIGGVIPGEAVGTVIESRAESLVPGDRVLCRAGWQKFTVADAAPIGVAQGPSSLAAQKVELPDDISPTLLLGMLGMPGLTAWAGTIRVLKPIVGDTFVVSAATGPVGSTAGQLAKRMGARVVGIAGGPEKCAYARDVLGFDECIDHRDPDWVAALAKACPAGIDCFYDGVGGRILEGVLGHLALGARVVLVGLMEQYKAAAPLPGPNVVPLIKFRATMEGLVVFDHWPEMDNFRRRVIPLVRNGQMVAREERLPGLDAAPAALVRLMAGGNFGKMVLDL